MATTRTTSEPQLSASAKQVLSADELRKMDAYWRACNYLCAGMIYLRDNPLLREPLRSRAHQESPARPLGLRSRPDLHLGPSQSASSGSTT